MLLEWLERDDFLVRDFDAWYSYLQYILNAETIISIHLGLLQKELLVSRQFRLGTRKLGLGVTRRCGFGYNHGNHQTSAKILNSQKGKIHKTVGVYTVLYIM